MACNYYEPLILTVAGPIPHPQLPAKGAFLQLERWRIMGFCNACLKYKIQKYPPQKKKNSNTHTAPTCEEEDRGQEKYSEAVCPPLSAKSPLCSFSPKKPHLRLPVIGGNSAHNSEDRQARVKRRKFHSCAGLNAWADRFQPMG